VTGTLPAQKLALRATLADKTSSSLALPAGLFPVVALSPAMRTLEFTSDGTLPAYYLVEESGFDRKPDVPVMTQGLEVTREFLDATGKPVDKVKVGDELTVRVRFRAIGRSRIDDAVLVDLLPGGFDLVVPSGPPPEQELRAVSPDDAAGSDEEGYDGESGTEQGDAGCTCVWLVDRPPGFPDFADLREDRVVLYGRATDQVQEASYRIKATNVGAYTVPPAYGHSMYDTTVRARSAPGRITVVAP
jgi:uncharacterized protein YfaS (alpha-2-macroglobulin family)